MPARTLTARERDALDSLARRDDLGERERAFVDRVRGDGAMTDKAAAFLRRILGRVEGDPERGRA